MYLTFVSHNASTQIAISVCSNLALQVCSKFDTARVQVSNKLFQTTKSPRDKFAASLSSQIHCKPVEKREYAYDPSQITISVYSKLADLQSKITGVDRNLRIVVIGFRFSL
ncbi:hypothetical protein AVEN_257015-1 [Araneus ventricosus]|uniref:Uncharacterized protein n=1 Tax=Araneus ventricosus TaxID=182803 RepID=A0A4Y2RNK3_ARAVE|nr:hypothetical protein AVEN_257015-1 [Araneus ventricosus]